MGAYRRATPVSLRDPEGFWERRRRHRMGASFTRVLDSVAPPFLPLVPDGVLNTCHKRPRPPRCAGRETSGLDLRQSGTGTVRRFTYRELRDRGPGGGGLALRGWSRRPVIIYMP